MIVYSVGQNTSIDSLGIQKEIYQDLSPLPELLIIPEHRIDLLNKEIEKAINKYGFQVYKEAPGTYKVIDGGNGIKYEYTKTGTFDGLKIVISPDLTPSEELFTKLHLFGHSIQLCSEPASKVVA